MKGNRVEAADEWVNGSWTVDCICGVTFDDGEEMVNCDECGVWVHTRCSRYVKGHKSFACDKCKSQRRTSDQTETEVAQLLAELPTKTIHHHQNQPQHHQRPKIKMSPTTNTTSSSSPYRLWTQRPLQERVHVQGVPGGPSSLFHSTAFPLLISPLLWKSSGYIPKHFNFRYSEFPSSQLPPPPPPALTTAAPLDLVNTEGFVQAAGEIHEAHPESPQLPNDMPKPKLLIEDLTGDASKCKHIVTLRDLDAVTLPVTDNCCNETKSDALIDNPKGGLSDPASMGMDRESDSIKNLREHVWSPNQECIAPKLIETEPNISKPLEQDSKDIDDGIEAVAGSLFDGNSEMTDVEINAKLECSSMQVPNFLHGSKEFARVAGQKSQLSGPTVPLPPSHHKMSSLGQTSSISPTIVLSRSSLSNKSRSGGYQNLGSVGKCLMSNSCVNNKKEYAPVELKKNKDKHDKPMSVLNDNPKTCFTPTLKPSQPSTVLKYNTSAGKDSQRRSSSKPSVDCSTVSSSFGEPAGTLQGEHGLHGQNKDIAFGDRQLGEKDPATNFQPSSKSNQSSTGHPTASSNSPAGLSDEELALLLHQELNSSPRVPRVPRVRHPGSLPQISSATTANMLMKRTSTSGGKDKNTFSRRKSRGSLKDGSHNSRDQDTEASKGDRVPSSSSDSLQKSDAATLAEVNTDSKMKKNLEKVSSSPANSGPFSTEAVDFKSLSARVDIHEDEAGANKNSDPTYRTLPGLIAEIMGTGRRMTYEELCNAVLPHWSNLRKHNGERYAYSSHSQAVLDCLRNRTEWARLVDRGPKTSSSRKKRKIDAEPLSSESEDGEDRNPRDGENKSFESNKEEFPKGRRNVRKRRKAAPPGRTVKDGQKRRKVEAGSSCDSGSFSNSSEDSVCSQDDCGGSETNVAKIEVSAGSQRLEPCNT